MSIKNMASNAVFQFENRCWSFKVDMILKENTKPKSRKERYLSNKEKHAITKYSSSP
ncbi:unnamed protein product, partial [Larinioides sclopetarius]